MGLHRTSPAHWNLELCCSGAYVTVARLVHISLKLEKAMSLVANAEAFARRCHAGQTRKGVAREPYIIHLEEVAGLVAKWGGSETEQAAAWLHDTVEDCPFVTLEQLEGNFGATVASTVSELTDDKSLSKAERKALQVHNASKKTSSAALVKLADKTSNIGALSNSPPEGWDLQRRLDYVAWAQRVVEALPYKHVAGIKEFGKRCDLAILKAYEDLGSTRQAQNAALEMLSRKAKRAGLTHAKAENFIKNFVKSNL